MLPIGERKSRRRFLQHSAQLGVAACCSLAAVRGEGEKDVFDCFPKSVWANARRNGLVMIHRPAPSVLSWQTQIVPTSEPGQPVVVKGQVFAPDRRSPLEGITVYAYNTDAKGFYGKNPKDWADPPRLYGWMKTDANGRFELRTIYPGHYPDMHVPSHVHFTVWGRGYPPQWIEELRFEGDPFITAELLEDAAKQGQFSWIQPLTRTEDGVLHCRYRMSVQTESNFR